METNTNLENVLHAWYDIPMKLWGGWLSTTKDAFSPPWSRLNNRVLESYEHLLLTGLRTQSDWTRTCINAMRSGAHDPNEIDRWADRAQDMADAWHEGWRTMWMTWFKTLKDNGSFPLSTLSPSGAQSVMQHTPGIQLMQDAVRNGMKLQAAWASLLVPFLPVAETTAPSAETSRERPEKKGGSRRSAESEQAA